MASEERRNWLLSELKAAESVSLTSAAQALGVSEMTVRRDLDSLESAGLARRVRGGAVSSGPVSFENRDRSHAAEKRVIAEKLLPLVPAEGVIAMDSSTTMHRLASLITGAGRLTVVTNGLLTFETLQRRPGVIAVLTGGTADERSDSLVGPVATATLDSMRFPVFFASAAAIDPYGCSEDTFEEAEVKRAFSRVSAELVVGAHAQKLGRTATASAVRAEEITTLATDLAPGTRELDAYRDSIATIL
ncbi:DeoR/GlpR family DNA-binding transcription regulator [Brevibacterium permense]|uniref:DeoR/GlpR family DNA-binding transcription regulator n=1 Tax=Brevibacterium permense TaxID=234834 RepID=UPI0021CF2EA8|nr:DeoR/GlpR family DNA-binding transcription regulator [Brevibacterium permense]